MSGASDQTDIPFITTEQMREVDRLMMKEYRISLLQMMENAGRNLAHLARQRFFDGNPRNRRVLVLAGKGGNGGGGLACARRLHNWGADVTVYLSAPAAEMSTVPGQQAEILMNMGVPVEVSGNSLRLSPADLIVDALIGYSLRGAPDGVTAALIRAANEHRASILALDVPSGVDAGTGTVHEPAIKATATMTLALPKEGLRVEVAKGLVGELYLADISVPPGLTVGPIFAEEEIVRLW